MRRRIWLTGPRSVGNRSVVTYVDCCGPIRRGSTPPRAQRRADCATAV